MNSKCRWLFRFAAIREAPRAEQPGVDDFATCPGLLFENPKVQIARPVALEGTLTNLGQLPPGIDGLRLDPSVPLPDDEALRFFLFHSTRAGLN